GPTTSVRITRTVVSPVQCRVWLSIMTDRDDTRSACAQKPNTSRCQIVVFDDLRGHLAKLIHKARRFSIQKHVIIKRFTAFGQGTDDFSFGDWTVDGHRRWITPRIARVRGYVFHFKPTLLARRVEPLVKR